MKFLSDLRYSLYFVEIIPCVVHMLGMLFLSFKHLAILRVYQNMGVLLSNLSVLYLSSCFHGNVLFLLMLIVLTVLSNNKYLFVFI